MDHLFSTLDALLELPISAFEKKLTKFEEDFRNISLSDISEEELESYFLRIKDEYSESQRDAAKTRLATLGYLSHFDTLVEKFFPDYVILFQTTLDRPDAHDLATVNYGFSRAYGWDPERIYTSTQWSRQLSELHRLYPRTHPK
jgi:hypothetical protein